MTEDLAYVIESAQAELGALIDLLDREGGRYAKDVATSLLTGRTNLPSATHLPRPIAAMIRESVMDAAEYRPRRLG